MSGTVDSRVVSLQFDNAQFEQGVKESLASIQALNDSLNKMGGDGFSGIRAGSNETSNSINGIASSVSALESRFSTMGIIGMTVLQNLTTSAMGLISKLTHQTISGGITRALNIEQARFQMEGLKMDVEKIMGEGGPVQNAVKGTAYGLDEAAKAASMLGASGIKDASALEGHLKSIAGAAAMSGRDFASTADIFTTVASNGKLMTQQLRQFSFSGLNVAATLAKYFTEVEHKSGVTEESVNEMVTQGKIDFETFSKAMNWAFGDQAQKANETFTGVMANVKAALGRIGGDLFGGSNGDNGVFENIRRAIIGPKEGLKDAVGLIGLIDKVRKVIQPLTFAFNDFGVKVADKVYNKFTDLANALDVFVKVGKDGKPVMNDFQKDIMTIVKSVSKMGAAILPILGKIAVFFGKLIKVVVHGLALATSAIANSNFFSILEAVTGSVLSAATYAIEHAGDIVSSALEKIAGAFKKLKSYTRDVNLNDPNNLFGIFNIAGIGVAAWSIKNFTKFIFGFKKAFEVATKSFFLNSTGLVKTIFPFMEELRDVMIQYQNQLKANAIRNIALAIALLVASLYVLSGINTKGLAKGLAGVEILLVSVTACMRYLIGLSAPLAKENVKAFAGQAGAIALFSVALIGIAASVLILASAVKKLSGLKPEELAAGLSAVMILLISMVGVMNYMANLDMDKLTSGKMIGIALALLAMSAGISILADAVKDLAGLDTNQLVKGLAAVGSLLVAMMLPLIYLGNLTKSVSFKGQLISIAIAMLAFAAAIKILASVVKDMSQLNPSEIGKGLMAMAGGMAIIVLAMISIMKYLNSLNRAFTGFGFFNSTTLIALSVSMLAMAAAVRLLAGCMEDLGKLDGQVIAKGLAAMAGAMIVLTTSVNKMSSLKIVPVAVGMMLIAKAFGMLVDVIGQMGSMDLATLYTGIGGLVGLLLGVAGIASLLSSAIVPMMGLGAAMILVGTGLTAIGFGINAIVGAFATLVAAAKMGKQALAEGIEGFKDSFKLMAEGVGLFISEIGSAIIAALPGIIDQIIAGLTGMVSKFTALVAQLATTILAAVQQYIGPIVEGLLVVLATIIDRITAGIAPIIANLVLLAIEIINKFAAAIEEHKEQILSAFENIVTSIINLLLALIPRSVKIAAQIIAGLAKGLWNKRGVVIEKMKQIGGYIWQAITFLPDKLLGLAGKAMHALAKGIQNGWKTVKDWFAKLPEKIKQALAKLPDKMKKIGKDAIEGFLKGLSAGNIATIAAGLGGKFLNAIKKKLGIASPSKEMAKIGVFAIQGLARGLSKNGEVEKAAEQTGLSLMNAFQSAIDSANEVVDEYSNPVITPVVDLSSAEAGASTLNNLLSSQYAMSVGASINSSRNAMTDLKDSIVSGLKDVMNAINEGNETTPPSFEVPISIDGREVARATATYTQDELDKLQARENRQLGFI